MSINTAFHKHLRSALNHFYDHEYLRQCQLAVDLGIANRFDVPVALRKILTDAIEAQKPAPGEPINSTPHQLYDVLLYRYVQQFEQEEVAHHLGVSERHMRRIQAEALDALACHLWEKYSLEDKGIVDSDPAEDHAAPHTDASEWSWLKGSRSERVTDTRQALNSILELTRPLAKQNQVELEFLSDQDIPDLAVHPVALRQIMLNLLGIAIHRVPGGEAVLRVSTLRPFVELKLDATLSSAQQSTVAHEQEHSLLDIATHMAALCGANLSASSDATSFHADLSMPVVGGIAVLVIDDNEDIIHLLQRYAAGTRYAVTGTTRPDKVLDMASDSGAQVIVLDVMMPKVDGWEMLGRLRQHPRTAHIPVITLTILAQEELALSLGARAHLMKPVTQEAFLLALDRISATRAPVLQ